MQNMDQRHRNKWDEFVSCDQKIEHLNDDFYDGGNEIPLSSNDPAHLFEIGNRCHKEGTIGVLAGQLGLISHYVRLPDIPYLVKLNSKSHMVKTTQRPYLKHSGIRCYLCP